jgi:hypothetical protein
MRPFEDSVYGPLGVVNVTMRQLSEVLSSPSLLPGYVAELAEGDIGGAVNTLHQRHVVVVVFYGESGVAELGNNEGLAGHSKSLILSWVGGSKRLGSCGLQG